MTLAKSILTVTLNPAIDKIAQASFLGLGRDNNITDVKENSGGKGINVSRALKCLGLKSVACGFAGGANGQNFLRNLLLEGIEHNFVFIAQETRVNLTICDRSSGKMTRILEPGPAIDKKDLASFRHKFKRMACESSWVVLSGRGILGTPKEFYRELVTVAGKAGAKVVVDASGQDLRFALSGKPFLVKPNLDEAQAFLNQKLQNRAQLKTALIKFLSLGARNVIISLGSKGVVATDGKVFCSAVSPSVKVLNPVGSGDALAAGFIYAIEKKSNFLDAVAFAVAAGTANTLSIVPGHLNRAGLGGILQNVIVKDI